MWDMYRIRPGQAQDVADALNTSPLIGSKMGPVFENLAPGEARTPDIRISLSVLTYKYDALTDCATGAMLLRRISIILFSENLLFLQKSISGEKLLYGKNLVPGEARTPDLRISLSVLTYKYDALTDCATGAMLGRLFP